MTTPTDEALADVRAWQEKRRMRRLTPLPREGRDADIARLILQRAAMVAAHKNTAVVDRKLRLARAHQLRREQRKAS